MRNTIDFLEKEQGRYKHRLSAMEAREEKIRQQYSRLKPTSQNLSLAQAVKDSELGRIISQRETDYTRGYNQMMDD